MQDLTPVLRLRERWPSLSAVAGEVEGNGEQRVGEQEYCAAAARRFAGPQNERRKGSRDPQGHELYGPEAEGKRLEAPRDERNQGYQQTGDLGARGQRDLDRQLDPPASVAPRSHAPSRFR
jgi:hypothetical protein